MSFRKLFAVVSLLSFSAVAQADLEPFTDYEASDEVYLVTTVKVDSNMGDAYLEGLRKSWIPGNEAAKKLGQIKDWAIYRSSFPDSGHFNLILVIVLDSAADMQPSKERYDAFIAEMGKAESDEMTDYAQENYPGMRKITGDYMMRKITIK